MNMEKMETLAKSYLEKAVEQIDLDISLKTRILNASFCLGKFFGIMDIICLSDLDAYCRIGDETRADRDRIMEFTEQLYRRD